MTIKVTNSIMKLLLLLVAGAWATPTPMLCQRKRGMRVYSRNQKIECDAVQDETTTLIKLRVPDYKQRTMAGHWLGIYEVTCETHYFFWGSYTDKSWKEPIRAEKEDEVVLSQGLCPSESHPTPLLDHVKPVCTYSWPRSQQTKIKYCVSRPTTIRENHGQAITSDEEPLERTSWTSQLAHTITGAIVIWGKPPKTWDSALVERYNGGATRRRNTLIIPQLQEAYNLVGLLRVEREGEVWLTSEGFEVLFLSGRSKRDNSQFADLQKSLQDEIIAKLNYESTDFGQKEFSSLCNNQRSMLRILNTLVEVDPDPYVKALLGDKYLTASVTDSHIVVWPCKPVEEWHFLKKTSQKGLCSTLVPIGYLMNGANVTGYLNLKTNHIENVTDLVDCSNISPQAVKYQKAGGWVLTLWNGRELEELPRSEEVSLPLLWTNMTDAFVPKWENHWLYTSHDFTFSERHYLTIRDLEQSMTQLSNAAETADTTYSTYMRVPFVGMPTIPSLSRCLELLCMLGGLLHIWGIICHLLAMRRMRNLPPPMGDEEMRTLYDRYKTTNRR
ncbi:MAG: hypothetical protein [Xiangshan Nyami-like virus]|uniref:Glycoprotein n=1 Tax=Xiangshan Nyami-like virus TaxID=2886229 RepID=A0A8K1YQM9_9MONO|nr:MAG: hypothetical protein QKV38_gp4 [Xiangshan Nyami-like virus]UDL13959.1 MAG: hypothetical protein [Xiangshan Nyami-like virus]